MSQPYQETDSSDSQNVNAPTPVWEVPYIGKRHIILTICGCALFIIISAIAFFWRHDFFKFGEEYTLDNSLLGTLVDFVGGILGTILAIISFLMMYWTLKAQRELTLQTNQFQKKLQIDLNKEALRQAELQRFNDLFFELLTLYHRQKRELDQIYDNGHSYFDIQMKFMQDDFKEYVTFGRGWRYAKEKYEVFYLENASKIGPLFRTLYRLFSLTDSAPIDNDKKLDYAKTVRAQLSEGELFFLRYNCISGYGRNFLDLLNKYRVCKHLPFLSLLENTSLRNKLTKSHSNQGLALNWIVYSLWKEIYNRIVGKTQATGRMEYFQSNSKYKLSFAVTDPKQVIVKLEIDKKHRNNTPALRCLDSLSIDEMKKLLYDFLREVFLFSNSKAYNDEEMMEFKTKCEIKPDKETIWSIARIKDGKLRVSHPAWDSYYGILS